MNNDFLSRWSRRKLRADPAPAEARDVEAEASRPSTADGQAPDEPVPAQLLQQHDGAITPVELAALPAVEDLTAASDISAFLRKGVPSAVRNQALRRMWAVDPAIRDFVGDARDYAWDWNTLGGVPCSGPLSPTIDVGKMVQGIFGQAPEELTKSSEPVERVPESIEREDVVVAPVPVAAREPLPGTSLETSEDVDVSSLSPSEETFEPTRPTRSPRHGGAMPS